MKRKLKWIGVLLVVLVLGFGTAVFLWPRDRITADSWKQIRIGMTEKEVEEILGGQGIDRNDFVAFLDDMHQKNGKWPFVPDDIFLEEPPFDTLANKVWYGNRGLIHINFDEGGNVLAKGFRGWHPADPTFLDRLRDWLGW